MQDTQDRLQWPAHPKFAQQSYAVEHGAVSIEPMKLLLTLSNFKKKGEPVAVSQYIAGKNGTAVIFHSYYHRSKKSVLRFNMIQLQFSVFHQNWTGQLRIILFLNYSALADAVGAFAQRGTLP